jgi:hypothetical protein
MAIAGYTYPVVRFLQRYRNAGVAQNVAGMPRAAAAGAGTASAAVSQGPTAEQRHSLFGTTLRRMALAASLSGVALLGTWGATQQAPAWADKIAEAETVKLREKVLAESGPEAAALIVKPKAKEYVLVCLSLGAIVGTLLAALMGDWLGRRNAYFLLCVLAFGSVLYLFQTNTAYSNHMLGVLLRMVAAVFARAVRDQRAGDRPGIRVQLRPHSRRDRLIPAPGLGGKTTRPRERLLGVEPRLCRRHGLDLVRAGDEGQAVARVSQRRRDRPRLDRSRIARTRMARTSDGSNVDRSNVGGRATGAVEAKGVTR